jgi:hypothetical protein
MLNNEQITLKVSLLLFALSLVYFMYAPLSHLPHPMIHSFEARNGASAKAAGIAARNECDVKHFESSPRNWNSRFLRDSLKVAGVRNTPDLKQNTGREAFFWANPFKAFNFFKQATGQRFLSEISNKSSEIPPGEKISEI